MAKSADGRTRRVAPERVDHDVGARRARLARAPPPGRRRSAGRRRRRARARARAPTRCAPPPPPSGRPPRRAAWIATWPTTPLAPSTTTVSPGASRPRSRTDIHPASPATPRPPASTSPRPSGTATSDSSGAPTTSAKAPVMGRHHTRVPAGSVADAITSPMHSAPAVKGGSGKRHVEAPRGDGEIDRVEARGPHPHERPPGRRRGLGGLAHHRGGAPLDHAHGSHRGARYTPPGRRAAGRRSLAIGPKGSPRIGAHTRPMTWNPREHHHDRDVWVPCGTCWGQRTLFTTSAEHGRLVAGACPSLPGHRRAAHRRGPRPRRDPLARTGGGSRLSSACAASGSRVAEGSRRTCARSRSSAS